MWVRGWHDGCQLVGKGWESNTRRLAGVAFLLLQHRKNTRDEQSHSVDKLAKHYLKWYHVNVKASRICALFNINQTFISFIFRQKFQLWERQLCLTSFPDSMTVVARIRFCDEPLLSTLVVLVSTKEIQLKNKTLSKCWAQQGGGVGWTCFLNQTHWKETTLPIRSTEYLTII